LSARALPDHARKQRFSIAAQADQSDGDELDWMPDARRLSLAAHSATSIKQQASGNPYPGTKNMKHDHLKITSLTFALPLLFVFWQSAAAQIRNQVFVGTRPISMGEAFVAVADDGNTIYWNPAGLARMERIQVNFAYADLFGLDIQSTYASFLSRVYFIPPLADYLAFGFDWFRIHTLEPDPYNAGIEALEFSQDQINFSLAFRPPKSLPLLSNLSVGANLKYLKIDGSADGGSINAFKSGLDDWGWDAGGLYDLGALPHVPHGINLGLMIHNVGDKLQKTATSKPILLENIRWGLSYRPFSDWPGGKIPISDPVLALDFDDRVHVGLEFWLARTLALRAGWQKDWRTNEKAAFSFGVGFKQAIKDYPEVRVDYALTDTPVLPNTNKQFGGSLLLRDNPRAIRIAGAQIENVFASLYRHYEQPGSGLGSIKLKNVTEEPLTAWVTFKTSDYAKPQAAPDTVTIPAKSTIDFPLRAIFTSDIIYARETRLTGEVKVAYDYRRAQHTTAGAVDFALCGKNYLTWDDPGKAAAFVTYDEPLVKNFVDQALEKTAELEEVSWFARLNMSKAMIIFRALQAYGVKYRVDPVTPFPSLADTLRGAYFRLDKIQYPVELLIKEDRAGDCDDLSALYASMLQYAGLPAAFVSGPGHIFIMFDTHLPAEQIRSLPVSPRLFVKRHGTLWIPIETTMIPRATFSEAWDFAAGEIDSTYQIHEVAANQRKYPPVAPGVVQVPTQQITISKFAPAVQADLAVLENLKTLWLQKVERALEDTVVGLPLLQASQARNVFGVLLGQNDEYSRARSQFQKIVKADSAFVPAWNNLGNIEFVTGDFAAAEKAYRKALRHNPYSRGTHLNLAILFQMMQIGASPKDSANYQRWADAEILRAAQILEGDAQGAFDLLQFPEESADGKAGGWGNKLKAKIQKVKDFVDRAFRAHVQRKEIRGVALDRHGAKGRGEVDDDRSALLAWIY
jgi:tetratricopeptide (TPR) repeat protein